MPATSLPADVLSFSRALDREVFENELSSACVERATAANARYSAVSGTTGSDPDNFVHRPAMGAVKRYLLSFSHAQCAEFPTNQCQLVRPRPRACAGVVGQDRSRVGVRNAHL